MIKQSLVGKLQAIFASTGIFVIVVAALVFARGLAPGFLNGPITLLALLGAPLAISILGAMMMEHSKKHRRHLEKLASEMEDDPSI